MLIYLVYLTYCKICDWLYGYKDTDLASLRIIETIEYICSSSHVSSPEMSTARCCGHKDRAVSDPLIGPCDGASYLQI